MKALLLIDIQNDFLPGGSLPVSAGNEIIPVVNEIQKLFNLIIATKDWHPLDHGSFAVNHKDKKEGDLIDLFGLEQILWPVHCMQNTPGAEFPYDLDTSFIDKVFFKGEDPMIDSYSGFYDNGHEKSTGMGEYLQQNKINEVYIAGLATDYCVKYTASDALQLGFKVNVIRDATRAVNIKADDYDKAIKEMREKGANIIDSSQIP
ncbi:bifunctional nicotinamidase/pyrazinamidase [soil metagenome]